MSFDGSSARWNRPRLLGLAALIVGLVVRPAPVHGQDANGTDRLVAAYERPSRVAALHIPAVVQTLGVGPGMSVADLGAGSGLFTRPFARAVGDEGRVYAVEIAPEMLAHIEATDRERGIRNVRTVLAGATDPGLPDKVDLVFMCDMLHQVPDKSGYLDTVGKYLQAAGRIAVIDLERNWPTRPDMRYTKQDLETMMSALGYEKVGDHGFIPAHFFVVFQRPGSGP